MRTDILERKEEILQWIEEEKPKRFICEQLNCKPETLNSYLEKMDINYAGQQAKKGQYKGANKYKDVFEYLEKSTNIKSSILRKKLIESGVKEDRCEICGISEWQGVKLPLELHHKDTNHYNNSLENLQILCPNCHSIQEGNSGAAIGTKVKKEVKPKTEKLIFICPQCGQEFSGKGKICRKCYNFSNRIIERPNRDELKTLIRNNSFLSLSKKFGISDNAIRKWCKSMNLPHQKTVINSYSDEEWEQI